MAESNATQVILTDDGIKIIKAQNTAGNAASQASKADSAALIAQSTANAAKSAADSSYKYANSEIAIQSTATAKAQKAADDAFSKAQAVGSQASKEIAVQSTATAKAQSKADDAFSRATTAIDSGKVTSQAVTDLKDGSKLTIAELENGLATKVANSEYASYKEQTASQIGQLVTNGAFSAYQQTTADLISSKVATKDFSAYQDTTAKAISSKVESKDFNTYKTQTDDLISAKVATKDFTAYQDTTAKAISSKVESKDFNTYKTQTDGLIAEKVATKDFSTYKEQTTDLIAEKVATKDFSAYQATTAKAISSKVESKDFNTYKTQTDGMIASKVSKKDANNVNLIPYSAMPKADSTKWHGLGGAEFKVVKHAFYHKGVDPLYELDTAASNEVFAISPRFKIKANTTYTFQLKGYASSNVSSMDVFVLGRADGDTADYTVVKQIIASAKLSNSGLDYRTVTFTTGAIDEAYIRVDNNGSTDGKMSILGFTELKLEPGDTATPYVYNAEDSMITQMSDDILLRVTKDGLLDQINLQAGNTLISSSGQLTLSGKNIYFDTANPVIIPSANITGTLNGKTINAGTKLNQYGNTSYPLTINPDGSVTSTSFEAIANENAALRTVIKDGTLKTNFRGMVKLSTGAYPAADVSLGAGQLALLEGYSNSQDPNFTATGMKTTGYAILDASTGLSLHGTTQSITFSGTDQDQTTGITMDSYGNIYARANSAFWRIRDTKGNDVVNFGIDTANTRDILFSRDTQVGNLFLGVGHTIGMLDSSPLYFKKGDSRGRMLGLYAGAIHYENLIKSSLLSVKRDVKKVDTAYWAQLVNSIDLATYQYKTDDNTSHLRLSSIVDDVNDTKQWQLPDIFVSRDENGKLCGVDDSVLLNATLATVQEQQKQISALNGHLLELEAKLNG